jgi:hypothetical protein
MVGYRMVSQDDGREGEYRAKRDYFRLEMDMNRLARDFFFSSSLNSLLDVEPSLEVDEKVFERCCVPRDGDVAVVVEGLYDFIMD